MFSNFDINAVTNENCKNGPEMRHMKQPISFPEEFFHKAETAITHHQDRKQYARLCPIMKLSQQNHQHDGIKEQFCLSYWPVHAGLYDLCPSAAPIEHASNALKKQRWQHIERKCIKDTASVSPIQSKQDHRCNYIYSICTDCPYRYFMSCDDFFKRSK